MGGSKCHSSRSVWLEDFGRLGFCSARFVTIFSPICMICARVTSRVFWGWPMPNSIGSPYIGYTNPSWVPASSKWPFDSSNGVHLSPQKVTLGVQTRSLGRSWYINPTMGLMTPAPMKKRWEFLQCPISRWRPVCWLVESLEVLPWCPCHRWREKGWGLDVRVVRWDGSVLVSFFGNGKCYLGACGRGLFTPPEEKNPKNEGVV